MQDQVAKLTQFGVSATFLGSGQPSVTMSAEARQGKFSVVYVTPESAKSFLSSVDQSLLGLIAIDESHCVSEWGHDFRPAYRTLNFIRDLFSHVPIMALTASATHDVQVDIINQLKMDPSRAFIARESFNRSNLYYETRNKSDFLRDVLPLIKSESSIIYTPTKKEAEMYAKMLQDCTISADFYTGDMDPASRERVHANFSDDKLSVVVATIAFGMGIDKPNVRTVIHWGVPKTGSLLVRMYYFR
jgi:ATP-dependent DNA helicase RecQ